MHHTKVAQFIKIFAFLIQLYFVLDIPVIRADAFEKWRGISKLQDLDMVEVATWVEGLADNVTEGLKYYWVNNELFYPYGAVVRAVFGIFKEKYKSNNISESFMEGSEALIHYMIMKSYPIEGRKGGVRGNGQDRVTLRAAIPHLSKCLESSSVKLKNLFPMRRRRRKRSTEKGFFSKIKHSLQKLKTGKWYSSKSSEELAEKESSETESEESSDLHKFFGIHRKNQQVDSDSDETSPLDVQKRYSYKMYHGATGIADNTRIVMPDKEVGLENIAASVFWLAYEIMLHTCDFQPNEGEAVMNAIDGIVALVVSLYLYDPEDFAEEYERIFKMSVKEYEAEWTKVEEVARKLTKEKDFTLRSPYTSPTPLADG